MKNFISKKIDQLRKSPKDSSNLMPPENNKDLLHFEDLKESEIHYRRLFETAQDGILILNYETGNIVDANPYIIRIIGYPKKEILGKKLWEIGLFCFQEQSKIAFAELQLKDYIRFENMPIQGPNGKITEVEFISNVYLVNNAKVIQCNIRKIGERKRLEELNMERVEYLDNLFKYANAPIIVWNTQLKIIHFNKAFESITGRTEKDVLGKPIDILFPPAQMDGSMELIRKTTVGKNWEAVELDILHADGGVSTLLWNSANNMSHDGKSVISTIAQGVDITVRKQIELNITEKNKQIEAQNKELAFQSEEKERRVKEYIEITRQLTESLDHIKNMNEELIDLKAKAEESDKLKTAFLANMSHEIRTPMNAIMGFSQFLLQPGLSKEKLQDFAQIINASSLQLMSVISDISDIAKIEAGNIAIETELVNINDLLNEIFVTYKKIVELKKLSLHYSNHHQNELIQIKTDGNRIKQVICNLLNNAIKFTREGYIEFGYTIKRDFIEFYTKDTGIGIVPENQELIFQRFRQVEETDNKMAAGNGLGLSISKALVEKLGGILTVYSALKAGSIFTFTIPYVNEMENAAIDEVTSKPSFRNWNEKTILIVEDEVNNHAYIEELLATTNVKILHAWDGHQAVEHVKKHSDISLVLMDIKMPIMDGYKATQLIKQIRPTLPVIAQTAYSISGDRKKILKAGCDNYIRKPIKKTIFMKMLNNYL
jgi:PAS domain S-box-containing protein